MLDTFRYLIIRAAQQFVDCCLGAKFYLELSPKLYDRKLLIGDL